MILVESKAVDWSSFVDGKLETETFEATLNSPTVKVVDGDQKPAIKLSGGADEYVSMTFKEDTCLNNLEKCDTGYTMHTKLKVEEFAENAFYISGGGQSSTFSGVSLFYRNTMQV